MKAPKVFLYLFVVILQEWLVFSNTAITRTKSSVIQTADAGPNNNQRDVSASSVLGSMYRKSRQSRCVRCYEDRYGYDDRSRGGYSSRSADDHNWYYPSSDYDRGYSSSYRDRDDRYSSRYYDRNEPRGSERYSDRYGGDRYGDRYSSDRYGDRDRYGGRDRYYDRYGGSDRYGDRDRYYDRYSGSDHYGDRHGDRYGDRSYYDRSRQGGDRDYYDRNYQRYDYRNYRPYDETYRGQSGFDNSGRGYYFAGNENRDENSRRYLPETGRRCGVLVTKCLYDRNNENNNGDGYRYDVGGSGGGGYTYGMRAPLRPTDGGDSRNNGSQTNRPAGGWSYMNEQDSQSQHGGSNNAGGSSSSSSSSNNNSGNNNSNNNDSDRDRNQQSSSYGRRPLRPLGGSYLFDRDNNEVSNEAAQTTNAVKGSMEADQNQQAQQNSTGSNSASGGSSSQARKNEANK